MYDEDEMFENMDDFADLEDRYNMIAENLE